MYTCRECEREINQATEICPYCGTDLTLPGTPESETPAKKPGLARILLRWGLLLGALMAALWAFLWFIVPERTGDTAAQAEDEAASALRELHAALAAYAAAQGGSFPASLETLGDRARGAAQRALTQGYQLQYTPGPVGPAGGIRNYALLARPGNFGYRNLYTDETGVLHATRENRPATAQDPPI